MAVEARRKKYRRRTMLPVVVVVKIMIMNAAAARRSLINNNTTNQVGLGRAFQRWSYHVGVIFIMVGDFGGGAREEVISRVLTVSGQASWTSVASSVAKMVIGCGVYWRVNCSCMMQWDVPSKQGRGG